MLGFQISWILTTVVIKCTALGVPRGYCLGSNLGGWDIIAYTWQACCKRRVGTSLGMNDVLILTAYGQFLRGSAQRPTVIVKYSKQRGLGQYWYQG